MGKWKSILRPTYRQLVWFYVAIFFSERTENNRNMVASAMCVQGQVRRLVWLEAVGIQLIGTWCIVHSDSAILHV